MLSRNPVGLKTWKSCCNVKMWQTKLRFLLFILPYFLIDIFKQESTDRSVPVGAPMKMMLPTFDFGPLFGDFGPFSRFWSTFSPFWFTWICLHMITSFKLFFRPKRRPRVHCVGKTFTPTHCTQYYSRVWIIGGNGYYIVRIHVYSRLFTIFGSAVFRQSEWWFVPR